VGEKSDGVRRRPGLYEAEAWRRGDGDGRDFVFDSFRGLLGPFVTGRFPSPEQ